MDWCGYSSPKFKFPSFGMWKKLDNRYSWPTSSAKRSRLPTPRDVPFSLYWKIYSVSEPKWLELPSFTKGLREHIKDQIPPRLLFLWCLWSLLLMSALLSPAVIIVFLQRWMAEWAAGAAVHHICLWTLRAMSVIWIEQQLSVSCIQQHRPLVPPTENQGTWKIVYLFQNAANCSPTEIEK